MRFSLASLRIRLLLFVLLAVVPAFGLTPYNGLLQRRHEAADATLYRPILYPMRQEYDLLFPAS